MDADDGLRASDRTRLVGLDGGPDAALVTKERLDHLQGAFDELSDVHTQRARHARARGHVLSRDRPEARPHAAGRGERAVPRAPPARERVRGALRGAPLRGDGRHARADRRRACSAATEEHRLARHARRCHSLPPPRARARDRAAVRAGRPAREGCGAAAAALALPPLRRRWRRDRWILRIGCRCGPLAERAAALVAVAALAGAGGAALGTGALRGDREAAGNDRRRGRALRGRDGGISSAAPPGPPRAESGAERARRPGGEPPVRQGAAPADTTEHAAASAESGSQHGTAPAAARVPPRTGRRQRCRRARSTDAAQGSPSVSSWSSRCPRRLR